MSIFDYLKRFTPKAFNSNETPIVSCRAAGERGLESSSANNMVALLRESEERYAVLAEQSGIVAWEVDAKGLYTYVSGASEAVLGYKPDELVGRRYFFDLHPEEGREDLKRTAFEIFKRKERFKNFVNLARRKDGRNVWLSTNGIPLLNDDGSLRGYRGSDADITEHRKMELDLVESQRFFNSIVDNIPDMVFVKDSKELRFVFLNKAGEVLLGQDRKN